MRRPADILLLDEPTNDLDIGSLDVLEESLLEFSGALVLVTHDRYLLDRVCDRVIGFVGEGAAHYYADYEQWLRDLVPDTPLKTKAGSSKAKKQPAVPKTGSGRLSYMDQRDYDTIEARIQEAEENKERLENSINDPAVAADPDKLQQSWTELEECQKAVEQLYQRWDELERKKEQGS